MKRWTASRKMEVVLRILKGESLNVLSRELGIEVYVLDEWRSKAITGMECGLKTHPKDFLYEELDQAKKRIGELVMENELLQIKARKAPTFHTGRSKK